MPLAREDFDSNCGVLTHNLCRSVSLRTFVSMFGETAMIANSPPGQGQREGQRRCKGRIHRGKIRQEAVIDFHLALESFREIGTVFNPQDVARSARNSDATFCAVVHFEELFSKLWSAGLAKKWLWRHQISPFRTASER